MASNSSDPAGIVLIKRAVELDESKRYAEALVCYREGIELLMDTFKSNKIKIIRVNIKLIPL